MTPDEIKDCEDRLLEKLENYLIGNLKMRVGPRVVNTVCWKSKISFDQTTIPEAHEFYGELSNEYNHYHTHLGEGTLVISDFTLTPIIVDPTCPDLTRGILLAVGYEPKLTKKITKIDPLDRY